MEELFTYAAKGTSGCVPVGIYIVNLVPHVAGCDTREMENDVQE